MYTNLLLSIDTKGKKKLFSKIINLIVSATKQGEPGAPGEEGLQGKDGLKVNYIFNIMYRYFC